MKKINVKHNDKDRIICVTSIGKHDFYYVPAGTKERFWLLGTKDFSSFIFDFFRKYGRNLDGRGFSLTIKEIYKIGKSKNNQVNKIMERIPSQVEYVIRENCLYLEKEKESLIDVKKKIVDLYYKDYEYAL